MELLIGERALFMWVILLEYTMYIIHSLMYNILEYIINVQNLPFYFKSVYTSLYKSILAATKHCNTW